MTEWRAEVRVLGAAPGLEIVDVVCLTAPRSFCPAVSVPGLRLGLPRSGGYVRRVAGREEFMGATVGFLMRPGEETSNAHPHGCGDRGTMIRLDQDAFADLFDHLPVNRSFATSGPLDLRHRALAAACARGIDEFEVAERFHDLVAHIPPRTNDVEATRRPATAIAQRRLVTQVRELLAVGQFCLGLTELAGLVGSSPHHLSRVFRRFTGRTLTAYRNELRVRAVCEALQLGRSSLRELAADHGFADQGHLTRVVRQYLGESPSVVRQHLGPLLK